MQFICTPCRVDVHDNCKNTRHGATKGSWCDCQHKRKKR